MKTEIAASQRRGGRPNLPAKKEHGLEERTTERTWPDTICDMAQGHARADLFTNDLRSPLRMGDVHKLTVSQRRVHVALNTLKGESTKSKKSSIGSGDRGAAKLWLESLLVAIGCIKSVAQNAPNENSAKEQSEYLAFSHPWWVDALRREISTRKDARSLKWSRPNPPKEKE